MKTLLAKLMGCASPCPSWAVVAEQLLPPIIAAKPAHDVDRRDGLRRRASVADELHWIIASEAVTRGLQPSRYLPRRDEALCVRTTGCTAYSFTPEGD